MTSRANRVQMIVFVAVLDGFAYQTEYAEG